MRWNEMTATVHPVHSLAWRVILYVARSRSQAASHARRGRTRWPEGKRGHAVASQREAHRGEYFSPRDHSSGKIHVHLMKRGPNHLDQKQCHISIGLCCTIPYSTSDKYTHIYSFRLTIQPASCVTSQTETTAIEMSANTRITGLCMMCKVHSSFCLHPMYRTDSL